MNDYTMDAGQTSLELDNTDLPGAHLEEVLKLHNITALRWWLLYRGIKINKQDRILNDNQESSQSQSKDHKDFLYQLHGQLARFFAPRCFDGLRCI